jgi:poly(3-hydroxyalkanoate) synthetase
MSAPTNGAVRASAATRAALDVMLTDAAAGCPPRVVRPEGSRASYRVADEHPAAPDDWAQRAVTRPGSWWTDYDGWLAARSGEVGPAPKRLGGGGHRALAKAPGNSVHAT